MQYVNFNPKNGFWQNDMGWVYSDDEATTVPFTSELSTVSNEGQYACVKKGAIEHCDFDDFLSDTLFPYLAMQDPKMISDFFLKEMEITMPSLDDGLVDAMFNAFADADRKTIIRLVYSYTDFIVFKDDCYGFWFTRCPETIKTLSAIDNRLYPA
jgi:hypothetical protein